MQMPSSNLASSTPKSKHAISQPQFAIRLSLAVGFVMLAGKMYAYIITNSAAILSDAAESVVHVIAVAFAAFSLWLSILPADKSHTYGHDKISFFSAGVEGMLIVVAAIYIIYEAVAKWFTGLHLENLGTGTLYVAAAGLINGGLGFYLVRKGKQHKSLILVANGKHVLTDSWTSAGVITGLLLVLWTGWLPFDPILAVLVALNILWSGGKLMRQSVGGLMDEGDPELDRQVRTVLEAEAGKRGLQYHQLRHRYSGTGVWVEVHLLFPNDTSIENAHWQATEIEAAIKSNLNFPVTITTHLEPLEQHEEVHRTLKDERE